MDQVLKFLDVAIGLVFLYAVLSLVVSACVELIHERWGTRARILETTIRRLLGDKLADAFYAHDRIKSLVLKDGHRPSYIEPLTFAECVMEIVSGLNMAEINRCPAALAVALAKRPDATCGLLWPAFRDSGNDSGRLLQGLQRMFAESNARATGWFLRKNGLIALIIGFIIAVLVNADSIAIVRRLSEDDQLRKSIVDEAINRADVHGSNRVLMAGGTNLLPWIKAQGLVVQPLLGWSKDDYAVHEIWEVESDDGENLLAIVNKLLGLLMTTIALSLGAPFWFDLLSKLVRVRRSVKPEEDAKPSAQTGAASTGAAVKDRGVVTSLPGGVDTASTGGDPTANATPATGAYGWGMKGMNPYAAEYSVANHYWMSYLAALAYQQDSSKIRAALETRGFKTSDIITAGTGTNASTQFFIARDAQALIVSFRGTEQNIADWKVDLDAKLQPWAVAGVPSGARFHKGFTDALDTSWEALQTEIRKGMTSNLAIWFTGHSLGAALAVLAAYRYRMETELASVADPAAVPGGRVMGVYTIGQPRVGNPVAARHMADVLENRIYRGINNRDVVPRVPPRIFGYGESGSVAYFNEDGKLLRDPGWWYRILDTVVIQEKDYKERAAETVRDHDSRLYVDLFHQACVRESVDVGTLEDLTRLG